MGNKHPIIGRGELYVTDIDKHNHGFPPKWPHPYYENKLALIDDINMLQEDIRASEEIFLEDKVVCVRMEPKFEAKSYAPDMLMAVDGILPIGGRKYTISRSEEGTVKSKLYFAKASDHGLENLKNILQTGEKDNIASWRNQISTIRSIDFLTGEEKMAGFPEVWSGGFVEIVLHPYIWEDEGAMEQFLSLLGKSEGEYEISGYPKGPLFCAVECTSDVVERLSKFNALRAVHPLGEIGFVQMRGNELYDAPAVPEYKGEPLVKVGVFDGGTDSTLPHLKKFVTSHDSTKAPKHPICLAHGTAVCGAVLYGALNYKAPNVQLETPVVSVESYRVLPQNNTGNPLADIGLYPVIDQIEKVVSNRKDIPIFNLSFGPRGAIVDDDISRFTYALDSLAMLPHHPLFCVAAGNDGDLLSPLNRVQAPADLVNGMGVGAYSYDKNGEKERAFYSCVGPGREGCKVKPDVLEFGGSQEQQVVLLSAQPGKTTTDIGTSFSAPILAGKAGKIMALSPVITPHMARTLLIHTADDTSGFDIEEVGFGFCEDDVNNILNCDDNKVVVLYEGSIAPKQNVRLPILLPDLGDHRCNAKITWTITTLTKPNPNDVDSYTTSCIEDNFYPHDQHFCYYKGALGNREQKNAYADTDEAIKLIEAGYTRSELPLTKAPKKYLSEEELRAQHLKWDTVIKKNLTVRTTSLHNPFFVLHGMSRDSISTEPIMYYAAITVEIPKYDGILYDDVLARYRSLTPVLIREENQLFIRDNR